MSSREYAYRIDVAAKAVDGSWWILAWSLTSPRDGQTHEAGCYWTTVLGEARRTWQQLNAGQKPRELDGDLSGWDGLIVSPVQRWVRFRNADGWGPWKRAEQLQRNDKTGKDELVPGVLDGTWEICTGVLADDERKTA